MKPMEPMLLPLRRYADFRGRSARGEFWLFTLFVVVASAILALLDSSLHLGGGIAPVWDVTDWTAYGGYYWSGGLLTNLFSLTMLIPSLAVAARRLHDGNRSGWWLLLAFVPVFGWLALLIFYLQCSWPLSNRWGAPATEAFETR